MNPFIISSIILSIAYIVILIINIKLNNKKINNLFLVYSIVYLLLILLFDHNFIYQFFKELISYIWFPNYLSYVITNIIIIIIFIFTLIKKKKNNYNFKFNRIISYILFVISFVCYNIYQSLGIDSSIYSEYYSNNSMILVRITSISFIIWLICTIILKIRGKYEK